MRGGKGKRRKDAASLVDQRPQRVEKGVVLELKQRPQPAPPMPSPPSGTWLRSTVGAWAMLWASPVSQVIDKGSDMQRLSRWCLYLDEWVRSIRGYRRERLVMGSKGQMMVNPLFRVSMRLENEIRRIEAGFGLSPADRIALGIAFVEAKRSLADLMAELDDVPEEEG